MKDLFTKNFRTNERKNSKFQVSDLVRVADFKKISKGDTTNRSDKFYKRTDIFSDTVPIYHVDFLPERYNEALLKKTKETLKEHEVFMKALGLYQLEMPLLITAYTCYFICSN